MIGLLNLIILFVLALVILVLSLKTPLLAAIPLLYAVLVFVGARKRAEKASAKIKSILMKEESVVCETIQLRPYALWHRRESLAITNSRIIKLKRGLLGGYTMKDYQWKNLKDVQLAENILPGQFGANLTFDLLKAERTAEQHETIKFSGVPSDVASTVYSHAQAQEQAWEEKRRVRDLEDKRAVAGGVIVHSAPTASSPAAPVMAENSIFHEIEKAKNLMDAGTISDAEFQELKAKILSKAY